MKRSLALMLVSLLCLQATSIGMVQGSLSLLTDGGQTDELDRPLVLWSVLNDGKVLTVDNTGNVSVNALTQGILSAQSTVFLDVDVNNARIDDAQELVTVAHDTGVLVVQMSTQTLFRNITTPDPVDDAAWDPQGELWLGYYAGKRRADEYNSEGPTGAQTATFGSGISAFEILDDGRLAIASYDTKIYIEDNAGNPLTTLTDSNSIVSKLKATSSDTLLAGTNGGTALKYNSDTWASQSVNLPHTKQTTYLQSHGNDMFVVGAKQGKVSFINATSFTEERTFTASGDIIGILPEFTGQFYAVGVTPTETKVRYFDLDSDGDGVNDLADAFPLDATQSSDIDGDGYGDNQDGLNPDAFKFDETQWADQDGDGYGDNPVGNDSDLFPTNEDQWQDADGDGYGDNRDGQDGDQFPSESTQWADQDLDGYGDNPLGFKPDGCPTVNAFSSNDRYGCPDSDLDGFSDPDENWTIEDGADALPKVGSQWIDGDGDGYGDASDGEQPDACPWEFGRSTKAVSINVNVTKGYVEIQSFGCLDEDGDGWVDRTESPLMDIDPTEHFDGDGDGVGSNSDYDDSRGNIQTEQDHCLNDKNDTSEACMGWNDPAYQAYLATLGNETGLAFNAWNTSKDDKAGGQTALSVDEDTLNQVIMVGIIAFVALTGVILAAAYIINKRKVSKTTKEYGGVDPSLSSSASREALEGRGGLSAGGGIVSDSSWDDDVEQLNFEVEPDGFADLDIKEDGPVGEVEAVTYEEESIEAIAGMPVPQSAEEATQSPPDEAPPLPDGGLPDGWTMDQWRWYGKEWLAKYGKN